MKASRFLLTALGLLAALVLVTGCNTVPITGRRQFNVLSSSQEMELGFSSFQQMKKDVPISREPKANALVAQVGRRIAEVAKNDLPGAQWEFVVFDSKEANAFCLPGGKVGVYTGLLPITKDEAGLATVLGHEIAHAAARHGGGRMTEAMALQFGGQAVGSFSGQDPKWQSIANTAYAVGSKVAVELPYSRYTESEADEIGLIYMARAGYDPEAAVLFWERFAEYNRKAGGNTVWFLRTHPDDGKRVERLKGWMPKAKAEYRPQK